LTPDHARGLPADLDRSIARLLTFGTYVSVALLTIGVVVMFARRIAPLAGGPPFQPELILDDILHVRPAGFMWLGLIAVIATPASRVVASLVGFARRGERTMAIVAALILLVIGLSVALARGVDA
jgi:uncharacterized membrane protein